MFETCEYIISAVKKEQYPNVKLSAFYAEQDIICNLDNYKDLFRHSVAKKLLQDYFLL